MLTSGEERWESVVLMQPFKRPIVLWVAPKYVSHAVSNSLVAFHGQAKSNVL